MAVVKHGVSCHHHSPSLLPPKVGLQCRMMVTSPSRAVRCLMFKRDLHVSCVTVGSSLNLTKQLFPSPLHR